MKNRLWEGQLRDRLADTIPEYRGQSAWLTLIGFSVLITLVADPVLAATTPGNQGVGTAFCNTDLAMTVKNIFTIIQFGGPLIGGVIALGATVVTPSVRRADMKQELKGARNQAILWGVIVAPLGTTILRFLLDNVVAGGASCGF